MIFKSDTFTTVTDYHEQRKALIKQIKDYYHVTYPIRLPKHSIILQKYINGQWLDYCDHFEDCEYFSNNMKQLKRLKTIDLIKKSN